MNPDDKKSKKLLTWLVALILASIVLTYYRSFISRDFEIIETDASATDNSELEASAYETFDDVNFNF